MFADPQTLTVNSIAVAMVKINQDAYSSEYLLRSSIQEYRLTIRNSTYIDKKRGVPIDRHTVQIVNTVYPVSPSVLSTIRKTYVVIENQQGDTLAESTYVASALFTWLNASSAAAVTKLLNFES
jgi:hypothetical protein